MKCKRSRRLVILFLCSMTLLYAALPERAFAASGDSWGSAIESGRAAAKKLMESPEGPPGLSIAVVVEGRVVWAEGFGFADLEQRVPVWPHTKMRIGSVSKPYTSTAIGQLYEQGKLDMDAPVQQYVPNFPKKEYPITTRHLAGHLAGIRHYDGHEEQEMYNALYFATVAEGLSLFQDDPLMFKPGDQYRYSSHGFNLLSAVVEGASGTDFLSYMQQNVFDPAGMRHTAADVNSEIILNRARFYVRGDDGKWRNARYADNSYKWAGGGFLSTPEDMAKFGWAILDGQLLEPETVRLFTTSQRTNDGKETGYGMGWAVSEENDRREFGHGGGSVGGASYLMVLPDQRVVIAMTINTDGIPNRTEFLRGIAEGFMK